MSKFEDYLERDEHVLTSVEEVREHCTDESLGGNANWPLDRINEVLKASNGKLRFKYYFHGGDEETGCHVFEYDTWCDDKELTDKEWESLKEVLTQEQEVMHNPTPSFCLCLGSLWHFVPYNL